MIFSDTIYIISFQNLKADTSKIEGLNKLIKHAGRPHFIKFEQVEFRISSLISKKAGDNGNWICIKILSTAYNSLLLDIASFKKEVPSYNTKLSKQVGIHCFKYCADVVLRSLMS